MPTISSTISPVFPDCLFGGEVDGVVPPETDAVGSTVTVGVGVDPWTVREALACKTDVLPPSAGEYALIVTLLPTMSLLSVSETEKEPSATIACVSVRGVPPADSVMKIDCPLEMPTKLLPVTVIASPANAVETESERVGGLDEST